ncbi:MAG: gamma-glutamylcyclotransferase family protein [Gemmobacter sp.]
MSRLVFGYGSLVHRGTHGFGGCRRAHLEGWERVWVHTPARSLAYLSVRPAPGVRIAGLAAEVPDADWPALDRREAGYDRHKVRVALGAGGEAVAEVYAVPPAACLPPTERHPILQSYLDTVLGGFSAEYGPGAVAEFVATTRGWEAPILNDRARPRYSRAIAPDPGLRAEIDAALAALGR